MSVEVTYNPTLKVVETLTLSIDKADDPTQTIEITGNGATLNATSTVPATKVWSDQRSLTAGTDSIDLTNLTNGNLPAVDMTGLKVQVVKIVSASANTDTITVVDGATNGYNLFGDASGQVTLMVGGHVLWFGNENLADVSSSVKTIDFSSSDTDATYDIIIVAG